jgi:hypothetical protein
MLIVELALVPYNYLRIAVNILKLVSYDDCYLFPFWVVTGLPYLLIFGVCYDMYYYFQILKDYRLDYGLDVIEENKEKDEVKMMLYNEIIYVTKIILCIY